MKNTYFILLTAALSSTATFADMPANCPQAFQGFHLGGNVGLGMGTGSQVLNVTQIPQCLCFGKSLYQQNNRLSILGFDGGLNTGYTYRMNNFLVGLEFVANWTSSKGAVSTNSNLQTQSVSVSANLNNSLQLRGNFSYVIANLVAPKFIIGWDASNWKLNSTLNNFETFNSSGVPVPFNAEKSKYLNGLLLGLGVDFLATKEFILGIDATVSLFNKMTVAQSFTTTGVLAPVGTITQVVSYKPKPYGKISLVAKFIY